MRSLVDELMYRNLARTSTEAHQIIREMRSRVSRGENPVDVLSDWGIESTYATDIM